MKTIQELAGIGAKAASEKLATLKGGGSGLLLAISPNSSDWSNDQPAREAFAQAVIDAFLDGVGDVPSVDECREMFDAEPSHKELQGLSVVRAAILTAVAKTTRNWQIAASARERMLEERVKELEAMNKRQRDDMAEARLAELEWRPISVKPTKEDADARGMVIVMKDREIGTVGWQSDWLNEAQMWRPAALPPVADKEREAFEAWFNLNYPGRDCFSQKELALDAWMTAANRLKP